MKQLLLSFNVIPVGSSALLRTAVQDVETHGIVVFGDALISWIITLRQMAKNLWLFKTTFNLGNKKKSVKTSLEDRVDDLGIQIPCWKRTAIPERQCGQALTWISV